MRRSVVTRHCLSKKIDAETGLQMFVKPHPAPSASEHSLQRCLAPFERFAPHVLAVQVDQIERVQKGGAAVRPMPHQIEHRETIIFRNELTASFP